MYAGQSNTTGYYNTFNGMYAGQSNTTGYYNTFNGMSAGQFLLDGIAVNATGNNNTYDGYSVRSFAATQSYEVVLGSLTKGNGSNTVTLGGGNNIGTTWALSYNNTNTQAGANLTIKPQSAFAGGTRKLAGGMTTIEPGKCKDWAFSSVRLSGNTRGNASTTLDSLVNRVIVPSSRILTNNVDSIAFTTTNLAADTATYGNTTSGCFFYQVSVKGTNGTQSESGIVTYTGTYWNVTATVNASINNEVEAKSTGTLVVTPTLSYNLGVWTMNINANSSLTSPVIRFDYVEIKGASSPTFTQF
jgi:hypothetical protein